MKLTDIINVVMPILSQVCETEAAEAPAIPRATLEPNPHRVIMPNEMLFPPSLSQQSMDTTVDILNQAIENAGFTNDDSKNIPYVEDGENYLRISRIYKEYDSKNPALRHTPRKNWLWRVIPKDSILLETNNEHAMHESWDKICENVREIAKTKDNGRGYRGR